MNYLCMCGCSGKVVPSACGKSAARRISRDAVRLSERSGMATKGRIRAFDLRAAVIFSIAAALVILAAIISAVQGSGNDAWRNSYRNLADDDAAAAAAAQDAADNAYYVLLVGNDSRIGTVEIDEPAYADGTARSDVIMLCRVAPVTHTITLVSIPRDYQYTLDDGSIDKINEVYHRGGIEALIDAVEDITGRRPAYYIDMGFVQFEDYITTISGVNVNVLVGFTMTDIVSGDEVTLKKGKSQELDAAQALAFSRQRKVYGTDMDAKRQYNNRALVKALIAKAVNDPDMALVYANELMQGCNTNFPADEFAYTVADFAANSDEMTIYSCTGPYEGGDSLAAGGRWVVTPDPDGWEELMNTVSLGVDPSDVIGEAVPGK